MEVVNSLEEKSRKWRFPLGGIKRADFVNGIIFLQLHKVKMGLFLAIGFLYS